MSSAIRLLVRNALYGITGVGGQVAPLVGNYLGAPYAAVEEDADRPMSNVLIPSRYRFWRTSAAPPGTVYLDLVGQATVNVRAAGLCMVRKYRGSAGFTGVKVYSGATAPASTLQLTLAVDPATQNDVFGDLAASTTAEHWRFEFTGVVGQFSCKPWLVRSLDTQTMGGGEGTAGATETVRRVREKEKEAFLGGKLFNDLGVGVGQRIREFRVPIPVLTATQVGIIRGTQRGNFVYQHHDGNYYECRHAEPELRWQQHPGTTVRLDTELVLIQVP